MDLENILQVREQMRPPMGPPWRIGWFGMIRCRKSLRVLSALADAAEGAIQIIIRGRPSTSVFSDFGAELKDLRNVRYLGPYSNPADLSNIYGEVLAELCPTIIEHLQSGGLWIATGVLDGASRHTFEKRIQEFPQLQLRKKFERRDAAPVSLNLWLCYEIELL